MDIALALWYIDQTFEYLLVNDVIVEWRSEAKQPSETELEAAHLAAITTQKTKDDTRDTLRARLLAKRDSGTLKVSDLSDIVSALYDD